MKPWVWYSLAWALASLAGGVASLLMLWGFYAYDSGRWVEWPVAIRVLAIVQVAVTGIAFIIMIRRHRPTLGGIELHKEPNS